MLNFREKSNLRVRDVLKEAREVRGLSHENIGGFVDVPAAYFLAIEEGRILPSKALCEQAWPELDYQLLKELELLDNERLNSDPASKIPQIQRAQAQAQDLLKQLRAELEKNRRGERNE